MYGIDAPIFAPLVLDLVFFSFFLFAAQHPLSAVSAVSAVLLLCSLDVCFLCTSLGTGLVPASSLLLLSRSLCLSLSSLLFDIYLDCSQVLSLDRRTTPWSSESSPKSLFPPPPIAPPSPPSPPAYCRPSTSNLTHQCPKLACCVVLGQSFFVILIQLISSCSV